MRFEKLTLEIFAGPPSLFPGATRFGSRCIMQVGRMEHVSECFGTLPTGATTLQGVELLMHAHIRNLQRYFESQG